MHHTIRLALLIVAAGVFASCQGCGGSPVKDKLKLEGEKCKADEECETTLCDRLPGLDPVCLRKCTAGCKDTEVCNALAPGDRFACVPERPGLCDPCTSDADCPYPGDKCLGLGTEKVCGRDCAFDGHCPASYRCADAFDIDGSNAPRQCQPTSGTCECTNASAGQTRPCSETNTFGTCTGVKTCVPPNGWDACSARVPASETCNGRDDNCNGQTDEGLGDLTCGRGECQRAASACANGVPQSCTPGDAGVEICDNKDNDCDGVVDNGFDKQLDVSNCGTCGNVCAFPHSTPACVTGQCHIGACDTGWWNADGLEANGCEYPCTLTNGGVEICDGLDNNCNGVVDDGFNVSIDPNNCGLCGHVCSVTNGHINAYVCVTSNCGIGSCNTGWSDCDQQYATGCEQNTSTDVNNCGGCNTRCVTPHATPACAASACAIQSCDPGWADCNTQVPDGCEIDTTRDTQNCNTCGHVCPVPPHARPVCTMSACAYLCLAGWVDLDGSATNGCEYACSAVPGPDVPELGFVDSNCDGIDGDILGAIFVDWQTGSDTNPGTMALPKRTVMAGINAAASTSPLKAVYVSKGVYTEAVSLHSGVSVYGGYDATAGWSRATSNVTTLASPSTIGVNAQNLGLATELQLFTITSQNATGVTASGDGNSSFGVLVVQSAGGVTIRGCTITPGNGAPGSAGSTGAGGAPGGPGGPAIGTAQGGAGVSPCGATGGAGGPGVSGTTNGIVGSPGTQVGGGGTAGPGGSWGAAGACGTTSSNSGFPAPPVSAGGGPGAPGSNGYFSANFGQFDTVGSYLAPAGGVGIDGKTGGGAGGGGSGGGTANGTNIICSNCSNISSGGGGGGGAGGCGGAFGAGGRGGGGSFGIAAIQSTVTVDSTQVHSQGGGNGGAGGDGGGGGGGGAGGPGAAGATRNNSCSNRSGGAGAAGATGGSGGQGGGAAGGTGGPSVCVVYKGTAPSTSNIACTNGTPGTGGPGGSNGAQAASTGTTGIATLLQQSP